MLIGRPNQLRNRVDILDSSDYQEFATCTPCVYPEQLLGLFCAQELNPRHLRERNRINH